MGPCSRFYLKEIQATTIWITLYRATYFQEIYSEEIISNKKNFPSDISGVIFYGTKILKMQMFSNKGLANPNFKLLQGNDSSFIGR